MKQVGLVYYVMRLTCIMKQVVLVYYIMRLTCIKNDMYHEIGRACLLSHETDLYEKTTCIMKQVASKLLHHINDLYQNKTCIMKQVKSKLLRHKIDLYQKMTRIMNRWVLNCNVTTSTCIKKRLVSWNRLTSKLLRRSTDLYKKMTCIMKQAKLNSFSHVSNFKRGSLENGGVFWIYSAEVALV